MSFLLRPQPRETLNILLTERAYNSNFNRLHVSRGNIDPPPTGDPTSYPTENAFGGDPNEAPSQNQRFCDGVPIVHFGVPGQKFIIFDWGKFREPHSGFCATIIKNVVPPSCGFPPHEPHRKYFRRGPRSFPLEREPTISGDTIGARARATALRHLCGAANYATCNAPASRRDDALPAYGTSCPRHSLRRRRTCKSGFAAVQVLAKRLQPRKSARRV